MEPAPREIPVSFPVEGRLLRGILHEPEPGKARGEAVVFLHGWGGYRIGPHRMFVTAARRLVRQGFHCLRFDFRGRGDSEGAPEEASIRSMLDDGAQAVEFLAARVPSVNIALLGICSGAKVAMGIAPLHARITALVFWSAEVMGPRRGALHLLRRRRSVVQSYLRKLLLPVTWRKLLTLRVNVRQVSRAVAGRPPPDDRDIRADSEILERFRSYRGRALFVHGDRDPETTPAMEQFSALCREVGIHGTFHVVPNSDHSFYSVTAEREALGLTERWLTSLQEAERAGE